MALITEQYYKLIIAEDLLLKQTYKNIMEIPKIKKVIVNTSSKIMVKDKKYIIPHMIALEIITGQKLKLRGAKKSIAGFKLREDQLIGCKVTIRDDLMHGFLEKLIKIIYPRLREFRGLKNKSFDLKGNYNLGIKNLLLFPELDNYFEFFEFISGINVTISLNTIDLKKARLFLSSFQTPITRQSNIMGQ